MNTAYSTRWKHWVTSDDIKTCLLCRDKRGEIYAIDEIVYEEPPLHENCRCCIAAMDAIYAGQATNKGVDGADFWVKFYGKLPDYYINKKAAVALGWVDWQGNLHKAAPGQMLGGDRYWNKNLHLPDAPGRKWFEADINYVSGRRNLQRLVYSNDGLIFVTYDHYETFYEII